PHGGPTLRSTERHARADRVQGDCGVGSVASRLAGGAACADYPAEIAAECFIAPRRRGKTVRSSHGARAGPNRFGDWQHRARAGIARQVAQALITRCSAPARLTVSLSLVRRPVCTCIRPGFPGTTRAARACALGWASTWTVLYDESRIAIIPMGYCYPGRGNNGDMPPRPECAALWLDHLLAQLLRIELTLLIGQYAQRQWATAARLRWLQPRRLGGNTLQNTFHCHIHHRAISRGSNACVVRGAAHTNAAIEDHDTIRLLRSSSKYSGPTRASSNVEGNIRPNADS